MTLVTRTKRDVKLPDGDTHIKFEEDGYTHAFLQIKQTYNNFFITVTDIDGEVWQKMSGGASGFKGTKRRSAASAEIVAYKFIREFEEDFCTVFADMRITLVLRAKPDTITNIIISTISDVKPFYAIVERMKVPHNGLRRKKVRRILFFKIVCYFLYIIYLIFRCLIFQLIHIFVMFIFIRTRLKMFFWFRRISIL